MEASLVENEDDLGWRWWGALREGEVGQYAVTGGPWRPQAATGEGVVDVEVEVDGVDDVDKVDDVVVKAMRQMDCPPVSIP